MPNLIDRISGWKHFSRAVYALGEGSNALNLILLAVMARLLGVEPYGQFIAVMAAAGILSELMEFGFPTLITREVARNPQSSWAALRNALGWQALMCAPVLAVLYAYMRMSHLPAEAYGPGLLIGLSFAMRSLKFSVRGVCRGLHRFGLESFFLWTERLGLLLLGAAALWIRPALWPISVVFLAVRAVDFAVFLAVVRRIVASQPAGTLDASFGLKSALPFALTSILWGLYYQVDAVMLSMLSTARDTGTYGALYRFVDILAVIPRLVIVVKFPSMALAWVKDPEAFRDTVERLQKVLTLLAVPVLLSLIAGSEILLRLIFGPEYAQGAPALRVILLGIFFTFHSMLLSQALQASSHERALAVLLAATVALNIALNAVLIPARGYIGAAIATACTEVVYMLSLSALAWRYRVARAGAGDWFRLAGATAVAAVVFFRAGWF